ncbi:MAG: hypothetical protein R2771_15870 [Saprospiraceae bacterium]
MVHIKTAESEQQVKNRLKNQRQEWWIWGFGGDFLIWDMVKDIEE